MKVIRICDGKAVTIHNYLTLITISGKFWTYSFER